MSYFRGTLCLNLVDLIQSLCVKNVLDKEWRTLHIDPSLFFCTLMLWFCILEECGFQMDKIMVGSGRIWFVFHNFISFSKIQKKEGIMHVSIRTS